MKTKIKSTKLRFRLLLLASVLVFAGCVTTGEPVVDESRTSRKLGSLPPKRGERKVVTIYEFRSSVPEVSAVAATDMFTTALMKSAQFAVAERQRLQEGVILEKQLNAQGLTTGDLSDQRLTGVDYIFEGTVSEANPSESQTGIGATARGLGIETSGERAIIGLDIRVIDARSGLVLDAINVRKPVKESGFSARGIGSFIQSFTEKSLEGGDLSIARERKEGVDQALRSCIEEAIYQLGIRCGE
jgi:curli biogenesis system outer membrane secretion channel CsgG